jgi:hypothetical protein
MLNHTVIPRGGRYLVVYPTPGCDVPTPVCSCSTEKQAISESRRLNQQQVDREAAIAEEHRLCGLFRIRSQTICAEHQL